MKISAPSELKRKNLVVNEDKTDDYCIHRTGDQSWKKLGLLGSLLGNQKDINGRKLLTEIFNIYKPILSSNEISFKIRIRALQALISGTFQLWVVVLSKAQKNKLNIFPRIFMWHIIRKKYTVKPVYNEIETSLSSGAHLGGQGPPRWAPEGRNCEHE